LKVLNIIGLLGHYIQKSVILWRALPAEADVGDHGPPKQQGTYSRVVLKSRGTGIALR
jgi:hypothetical protein